MRPKSRLSKPLDLTKTVICTPNETALSPRLPMPSLRMSIVLRIRKLTTDLLILTC
mgnify:CR=1 FL=1